MIVSRINCWDFFECGREPNGKKSKELGICPATASLELDGVNDGINGGRSCWAIAGTLCDGEIQGSYAQKIGNCLKCDFHSFVHSQQGDRYVGTKQILEKVKGNVPVSCTAGLKVNSWLGNLV